MLWLYITIGAYLLFALANIGDKLVVSKFKTEPIVYSFYVGFMGLATMVLIPFGVIFPDLSQIAWSFFAGLTFVLALYFMYKAINSGETTKAITIMGGSAPLFTFLLSYLFLGERLNSWQVIAFGLFILAIIIISCESKRQTTNKTLIGWAVLSGLVFASTYVSTKYIYSVQPFISGFVWIRIGGFLTAIIILLFPKNKEFIKIDWQRPKKQKGFLIMAIQVFGGLGVIGQNYAFSLASATLINALQAVQYAFIFILTSLLGKNIPALRENLKAKQIVQKIIAIIIIAVGLYILALN